MPKAKLFNDFGRPSNTIIQIITNSAQVYAPDPFQLGIPRPCSNTRLLSHQGQSSTEFLLKRFGNRRPVCLPPFRGLCDLTGGAPDNLYRKHH